MGYDCQAMQTPRLLSLVALTLMIAAGVAQGLNDDGSIVPLCLLLGGIVAYALSDRLTRRHSPPR